MLLQLEMHQHSSKPHDLPSMPFELISIKEWSSIQYLPCSLERQGVFPASKSHVPLGSMSFCQWVEEAPNRGCPSAPTSWQTWKANVKMFLQAVITAVLLSVTTT